MAVFNCPQCGHAQAVDDKHVGRSATCPKCKTQSVIQGVCPDSPSPSASVNTEGPSVRRTLGGGMGIFYHKHDPALMNKDSSLKHEWIIIEDPRMTVAFTDICGVKPAYDFERSSEHHMQLAYTVASEWTCGELPLSAVEIRYLTFDVWGCHVRTLNSTTIRDMEPYCTYQESGKWLMFSQNEAWEHFASIGYIARVRTADGKVFNADTHFVLREAQRFSEKFTEEDLEPQAPKKE